MVADRSFDVVVIGGGPVGLSAAQLLGRSGISTLLVERHSSTSRHPRACGIHGRTMELFRQWGIAGAVRRAAVPAELAQGFGWMTRLTGTELGRITFAESGKQTDPDTEPSPERPCFCPQSAYEPILLNAAVTHASVAAEFDTDVEGLDQDGGFVRLSVRHLDTKVSEQVRASYVIAADGAAGETRDRLGIREAGTGKFGHSVSVYFRADLSAYVRDKPFMLFWIVNGDTQGTIGAASPDQTCWTYNFDAQPGIEYSDNHLLREIRLAIGVPDVEVEILDVLRWNYEQAVAEHWRQGRVLLAGDAAHRFPPHGAFGMNSGVQDANNLAWKLVSVLRGSAGEALLDTYEAERKPVAERNSAQALANTRSLADTGWHGLSTGELASIELPVEGQELRQRIGTAVSDQRAHLHSEGQQFGTIYSSDAVVPDGTLPVASTISEYRETGCPGARAPHVWLRNSKGERLSTVDLFDGGFVLLAGARGEPWLSAAAAIADRRGIDLMSHQIGGDQGLQEDGRSWSQTYGIADDGAVLVRPDGHVGARFERGPVSHGSALDDAIGQILQVGTPSGRLASAGAGT